METDKYVRVGNYIYFGNYPQTIKANNVTVGDTAGSDGYYLGNDGNRYAKVTATPFGSGYKFSNNATVTSGTVYYFKVEPIKWRILEEKDGNAFILCESIIENQTYSSSSVNKYVSSEIRQWLNNEFYNKAFNSLQQELIQITEVDNSARSTNPNNNATQWNNGNNSYACANTNDKVFLLSEQEVTDSAYGFNSDYSDSDTARRKQTSDYSRATGAYMDTNSSYYGNGWWWLRSPHYSESHHALTVGYNGSATEGNKGHVAYNNYNGVAPALKIRLS